MRIIRIFIVALITAFALSSCSSDKTQSDNTEDTQWITKKVAVVLPMQDGADKHWIRTLAQCSKDLREAFEGQEVGINLEYEWYDEDSANLDSLSEQLAQRDDIVAVIGGRYSDHAKNMAYKFCRSSILKPFFTLATTEELIRAYSPAQCLWALTETDISQCETLLSIAYTSGAKSVTLIANSNSMYGKTFLDWFGFQAEEMGMEIPYFCDYADTSIEEAAEEAAVSGADFVICAPSSVDDIGVIKKVMDQQAESGDQMPPRCLYADIAFGPNVISKYGKSVEGLEGVSIGASPSSGYYVRYNKLYKDDPICGEPQVYDAAMMIGYSLFIKQMYALNSLNEAIKVLVDGRDEYIYSPSTDSMREFVSMLADGKNPDLKGVSGDLNFDKSVYTNVLSSTYTLFKIYDGKDVIIDYIANDGSAHTSSSFANWQWKSSNYQEPDDEGYYYNYPALDQKWALLVATSSGWKNYRHQADVLYMYQLLKKRGYDDDHIVLIAEDDIAYNTNNKKPGYVAVRIGGENLYTDVHVDYHPSDITPADLEDILCGRSSDKLKAVISADADDNVLFFWSGHGESGQLNWLDEKTGLTRERALYMFNEAHRNQCYRKMLCLVETCHANSVFEVVNGMPGILALTASKTNETSKPDIYNEDMEMWMTNRFTLTLQDCLTENPNISLRDLYYRLYINTIGSHVSIINSANYGNVYNNTVAEFL